MFRLYVFWLATVVGLTACESEMEWRAVKKRYCVRYQAFEVEPQAHDLSSARAALERRITVLRERANSMTPQAKLARPIDGRCVGSSTWAREVELRAELDAHDAAWVRSAAPPDEDWGPAPAPLTLDNLPTKACKLPSNRAEIEAEIEAIEHRLEKLASAQQELRAWYADELEVCRRNGFKRVEFEDLSKEPS